MRFCILLSAVIITVGFNPSMTFTGHTPWIIDSSMLVFAIMDSIEFIRKQLK